MPYFLSASSPPTESLARVSRLLLHGRDSAIKEKMSAQGFMIKTGLIRGDKLRQPFARCQNFPNERLSSLSAIEI